MEIIERDVNLEHGFAHIVFESDGKEYTLQACLMEREECKDEDRRWNMIQKNMTIYKKSIKANDDGMDEGISGDANDQAFKAFGTDFCMNLFKREIKKIGVHFV